MNKKFKMKCSAWLILMVLVLSIFSQSALETQAVTPSNENYTIFLKGGDMLLSNKETVGSEVGTECFMTYTVEKATKVGKQQGLLGTSDNKKAYPYVEKGLLRYSTKLETLNMLEEGATYFIRFEVATGGFHYEIVRVKGDVTENLYLPNYLSENTDGKKNLLNDLEYFGVWLSSGETDAKLTNVRCYDKDGKDLGIYLKENSGSVLKGQLKKDTSIDHWYDVSVNDVANIAIGQVKEAKTSKVYMEYKVESADYSFTQEGVALTARPDSSYPHLTGALRYFNYKTATDSANLLEVGAEYIICMERQKNTYTAIVQKTKNGVSEIYTFPTYYVVKITDDSQFFTLWFGEGTKGSFKLVNFKCYDEKKNNLGVQCNVKSTIKHHGAMEDYALCEATYYCKENGNYFTLDKQQKLNYVEQGVGVKGSYSISENIMTVKGASLAGKYDYMYSVIKDAQGLEYERLYNYKISFVTGTDEEIDTQKFSHDKGYLAVRPENPVLKGYDFEGWFLKNGAEYNFDQMVTESATLYAKFSGDGGLVYMAGDELPKQPTSTLIGPVITGGIILLAGLVIFILLVKRGGKNDKE